MRYGELTEKAWNIFWDELGEGKRAFIENIRKCK